MHDWMEDAYPKPFSDREDGIMDIEKRVVTDNEQETDDASEKERRKRLDPWGLLSATLFLVGLTTVAGFFSKFERDSQLRDGSKGFGLNISWPAFFPPLGIPIDHCLVSPGVGVCNRRTGQSVGSDHYPVIVDLAPVTNGAR